MTEYSKAGANGKLLDQEGIKTLIENLYSLKLSGDDLRKATKQLEHIQQSTSTQARTPTQAKTQGCPSGGTVVGSGQRSGQVVAQPSAARRGKKVFPEMMKSMWAH